MPGSGTPQKSPSSRTWGGEHEYSDGTLMRSKVQGPIIATSSNTSTATRHTFLCSFVHTLFNLLRAATRISQTDLIILRLNPPNGAAHNPPATGDEARPQGGLGRPRQSGCRVAGGHCCPPAP